MSTPFNRPEFNTDNRSNTSNTTLEGLKITGLTHDGRGVAKQDGKTIFVEDAVPGDVVKAKIYQSQDNYDEAKLIEIEQASSDRITPFCPHFETCGGCQLQHLTIEAQRHWKSENFLTRLTQAINAKYAKVMPAMTGEDQSYRRRARLGVAISKQDKIARVGFRQKHSNELVDIESCPILTPALNETLTAQRPNWLKAASRSYREINLIEADNGVFISQAKQDEAESSAGKHPFYTLEGLQLGFPKDGFVQINASINKTMVAQAIDWLELDKKHRVLDLFCGVGNFTLPIAQHCKQVVGIEGLSELVETAQHNSESNQLGNIEFYKANLFEDCTQTNWFRKQRYSRILLDPGRQGAFDISKTLHLLKPELIVYVSCNAATLIRDIKELEKQDYLLHKACLIDMFPHTNHTEVMVQLKKVKQPKKRQPKAFRF